MSPPERPRNPSSESPEAAKVRGQGGGEDLVARAEAFARRAHDGIDHRRRYSREPYTVHLAAVAGIVASVTADAEMIASAWLHDVVEDTPVRQQEVEAEFGGAVAALVAELTNVSNTADGNRARRKAIDREHLAKASPRAQTVKLADLIDNARSITRHDPRFAKTFLAEMEALLGVLTKGDAGLHRLATEVLERSKQSIAAARSAPEPGTPGPGV